MSRIIPISLFVALAIIGAGILGYRQLNTNTQPATTDAAAITVTPQIATSSVLVDKAILPVDGYVVVRGIDGVHLSQIIEISSYLEKGTYKNVRVEYGDENTDNEDLIVMLYADNGDKSFSGNTRPYKDANGKMVAVYVKTGLRVPDAITEPTVMMDKTMGMNMATVHYTNAGFEPKSLEVPTGTMVEFVNDSDTEMWVASNPHPEHDTLSTFDEFESVPKGGTYAYTFDKKGTWPYHDHEHAAVEGVIVVK